MHDPGWRLENELARCGVHHMMPGPEGQPGPLCRCGRIIGSLPCAPACAAVMAPQHVSPYHRMFFQSYTLTCFFHSSIPHSFPKVPKALETSMCLVPCIGGK